MNSWVLIIIFFSSTCTVGATIIVCRALECQPSGSCVNSTCIGDYCYAVADTNKVIQRAGCLSEKYISDTALGCYTIRSSIWCQCKTNFCNDGVNYSPVGPTISQACIYNSTTMTAMDQDQSIFSYLKRLQGTANAINLQMEMGSSTECTGNYCQIGTSMLNDHNYYQSCGNGFPLLGSFNIALDLSVIPGHHFCLQTALADESSIDCYCMDAPGCNNPNLTDWGLRTMLGMPKISCYGGRGHNAANISRAEGMYCITVIEAMANGTIVDQLYAAISGTLPDPLTTGLLGCQQITTSLSVYTISICDTNLCNSPQCASAYCNTLIASTTSYISSTISSSSSEVTDSSNSLFLLLVSFASSIMVHLPW